MICNVPVGHCSLLNKISSTFFFWEICSFPCPVLFILLYLYVSILFVVTFTSPNYIILHPAVSVLKFYFSSPTHPLLIKIVSKYPLLFCLQKTEDEKVRGRSNLL